MSKGNFFMPQTTQYRPRPNTYRLDNILIDAYANRIGPIGVAVYNVIARHADRDSGRCRIGIQKISQKLNISRTSAKKYIHLLFAEGLIAIIPQYLQQGGQTANHYLLLDITPEGRARRHAQLSSLLRNTDEHPDIGGSPRDRPPAQTDHLATAARSPDDPIQQSFYQNILPIAPEDDLPPIQRTCPHPAREVIRLSDGITICNRCFKLLDTTTTDTLIPTTPLTAISDCMQDLQQVNGGQTPQTTPQVAEITSEAASETNQTAAPGGRPGLGGIACITNG
jgi:hypothetical protein